MSRPLIECGKPLVFKVGGSETPSLTAPEPRPGRGQAIRLAVRALAGMQKEALAVSSLTGATWRLASDEGDYLNGYDDAPCPLSFLTVGMVSSYMEEVLSLARLRGIGIGGLRLIQDNYYTMKGSAIRGTMIGGAKDIELEAEIESSAGDDTLRALVLDAVAASPLNGLMRGCNESLFSLTHNGAPLSLGKARPAASPRQPDPRLAFETAEPAPGDWSKHILRGAKTPKTQETVTLAGDSLAAEQDRLLHVRGICTLRSDGIKHIEQHLYNPHGSIFQFLSEEGAESGGKGRAPDAASYIAAGIGFCFMTQLGRYAKILRKDLKSYRIVQDVHFSLGGASGGTGKPGEADPVETHLFIDSEESDDFARLALDMSEQTCFLHAFCRTALKARVSIARRPLGRANARAA